MIVWQPEGQEGGPCMSRVVVVRTGQAGQHTGPCTDQGGVDVCNKWVNTHDIHRV